MKKEDLAVPSFSAKVSLDFRRCLRGDYYHNDCSLCMDMCRPQAFTAGKNKLSIKDDVCIGCSACIGVCPTEALSADSFEPTLAVARLLQESKDGRLSLECSGLGACLATFDTHHLLLMILSGAQSVALQTAKCSSCLLDDTDAVKNHLARIIENANAILAGLLIRESIVIDNEPVKADRRGFLQFALNRVTQSESDEGEQKRQNYKHSIPLKALSLQNALKNLSEDILSTSLSQEFGVMRVKTIEDGCTGCRKCVEFCPTAALSYTDDGTQLIFQSSKCIGCKICEDICEPKVVRPAPPPKIFEYAFSRAKTLLSINYVPCDTCNAVFSQLKDETTCLRCKEFKENFSDMFATAQQMEISGK